jgi:hypothetical protein
MTQRLRRQVVGIIEVDDGAALVLRTHHLPSDELLVFDPSAVADWPAEADRLVDTTYEDEDVHPDADIPAVTITAIGSVFWRPSTQSAGLRITVRDLAQ